MDEDEVHVTIEGLSTTIVLIAQYVEEKHPGLAKRMEERLQAMAENGISEADLAFPKIVATALRIKSGKNKARV